VWGWGGVLREGMHFSQSKNARLLNLYNCTLVSKIINFQPKIGLINTLITNSFDIQSPVYHWN